MIRISKAEPYQLSAGALSLLVHGLFFSVLYFSFAWQMKPPQGMVVDIWDRLPSEVDAQLPPEKPEPQVATKVETAAPVAPPKAEIDLLDKKNKAREEKRAQANTAAKKLAEKQAEQAERRLEEVERQVQLRSEAQRRVQMDAAIATGKLVDEYVAKIAAKIRRYIVLPPGVSPNIRAEFNVTLLPSGEVLSPSLSKSSGSQAYDSAVERAILKAQPLPLPPAEKNMFARFRNLNLKFSPAESSQ